MGTAAATIVVGVPATVSIDCAPYDGTGSLSLDWSWVPAVIALPQPFASVTTFGGVTTEIPMTLQSNVHATGSAVLTQGWYTGIAQVSDNGVLSAGSARAVRIGASMQTNWSEFWTVSALNGTVTFDMSYYSGRPLTLTTTPAAGPMTIYQGQDVTLTVTGADNDGGTSLLYAWFLNGAAIALGTGPSTVVHGSDMAIGQHAYYSVVCFQSDGRRAGDVQFALTRADYPSEAFTITMNGQRTVDGNLSLVVTDLSGAAVDTFRDVYSVTPVVASHVFTLAAGSYKLAYRNVDGGTVTWLGGDGTVGNATVYVVPTLPATSVTFYAY